VVRCHHLEITELQSLPKSFLVIFAAQWRAAHPLRAFDAGLVDVVRGQEKVLSARLGENLRATTWSDGTALSYLPISEAIGTHPQYWVYNDDAATNLDILGYSYNYYSVYPTIIGQKEICPAGFSIPTKAAWDAVIAAADALSELPALDELMSPIYWNGQDPGSGLDLTGTGLRQDMAGGGDGSGTITPTTNQVNGWYTIGEIVPGTHIYENGSNVGTPPNIRMFYGQYNDGGGHYTFTSSYFPTNGGCAVRCVKTSTDPGIGVD
jgi:uncharacterized protein (TIGR02145 family)